MKSCQIFFLGFETDRTQAYNFAKYAKARKGRDGKIDKKSKSPQSLNKVWKLQKFTLTLHLLLP